MTPKPFGPSNIPEARNPRIGDVPAILHSGVISAVARSKNNVSDLGPFMYEFKSTMASLNVFFVSFDNSAIPESAVAVLDPPPRISSHLFTIVRSIDTGKASC